MNAHKNNIRGLSTRQLLAPARRAAAARLGDVERVRRRADRAGAPVRRGGAPGLRARRARTARMPAAPRTRRPGPGAGTCQPRSPGGHTATCAGLSRPRRCWRRSRRSTPSCWPGGRELGGRSGAPAVLAGPQRGPGRWRRWPTSLLRACRGGGERASSGGPGAPFRLCGPGRGLTSPPLARTPRPHRQPYRSGATPTSASIHHLLQASCRPALVYSRRVSRFRQADPVCDPCAGPVSSSFLPSTPTGMRSRAVPVAGPSEQARAAGGDHRFAAPGSR